MKPKSTLLRFLVLAASSLLAISSAHAVDGTWNVDAAGSWSTAANWLANPVDEIPGGQGSIVGLTNNITAARTITIDTDSRTVGSLTIGDSNNTHFFTLAASGGAGLVLDNSGSGATITSTTTLATLTSSRDGITAPVTLADNLAVSAAGTTSGSSSTGYLGISGNISESGGAKSITKSGNGTLVLTGNNSYSGGFILNAGTVQVTTNSNEVNNSYTGFGTGTLTINGGTIATRSAGSFTTANDSIWNASFGLFRGQTGVATWNHQGDVTLGANITPTLPNNGFTLNVSGNISETGGARSLAVSNGNFTMALSGNNTYTGGTNVTAGIIRFGKTVSMPATGTVAMSTGTTLIVNAGGTDEFTGATSGNGSIGALLDASAVGGQGAPVTWAGSSRLGIDTTNSAGGSLTYGGTIVNRGTSMGITKFGSGTLALTATDSSYTGSTVISSGVLEVSKLANAGTASSIGQSSNLNTNLIINTGATLRYTGTGDSTNRIFRIDGGSGSIVTLDASGSGAINFTDTTNPTASGSNLTATIVLAGTNTDANTYAANYGNNGTAVRNLQKTGTGTWVLTGTNSYTGATTISGGTLFLTGATQGTTSITFTGGSLGLDTGFPVTASSAAVNLAGGTIKITGATGASSYTLLTAASITGTPVLAASVPGYELQLAAGNTELRLVQTGAVSPYDTWSGGAVFDADANGDGVDNGLAFLLGASGPNVSSLDKLPVPTQSAGALVLTFQMLDDTANGNATLAIEYSTSLAGGSWTAVQVPYSSGTVGDIGFTVTGTGPLNVIATIPVSKAAGGKLFGRLKAVNP